MNKENKHNKELVLSILIPSFNDEDYIKQCLESILMNISEEFEVILNDDCSDDKTLEIANSFNDPRLKCNLAHTKLGTVDKVYFTFFPRDHVVYLWQKTLERFNKARA